MAVQSSGQLQSGLVGGRCDCRIGRLVRGLVADRRRQPYPASRTGASSRNCDCSSSLASSVLPRVPLGALYVSGRFFRRALRDERGKDWLAINRARNGVLTAFRCALVLRIRGGSGVPGRRRGGRKLWDRLHLDFRQERGLPAYGPLAPGQTRDSGLVISCTICCAPAKSPRSARVTAIVPNTSSEVSAPICVASFQAI